MPGGGLRRAAAPLLVAAVVVSLLVGVRPALACSCEPPPPGQPEPEVIVVAVAQTALVPPGSFGGHRWRMRVVGAARGDLQPGAAVDVSVAVGQGGGDCSVTRTPPAAGSTYLLTGGFDTEGTLHVSLCGGSFTPLADVPGGPISFAVPVPVPGPAPTPVTRERAGQTALLVPGAEDESHGVLTAAGVALLAAAAGTAMLASARLRRLRRPPADLS